MRVDGPGVLARLGGATPSTQESFLDEVHRTHEGRALAVIRPTGAGMITATVTGDGCEPITVQLNAD